ncbi:MAG: OmpH family outer membrane protein [Nitrospirae bacterium]|nr:OmpH family outer membrane protein [Nitrospirota bacterium]MBI5096270.1 OmpH family outer membrane protein [Nitrospirota bacterium]
MDIHTCKKTIYAVILGVFFYAVAANPACSEEVKIGLVDSQMVLDNSLKGKEVKEALNDYVQSRQKIVDIEEIDLRKLQEELTKQAAILSPETKQEKEELFQKKFLEYQKKVSELQKEIQQRRTEMLEGFNNELEKLVRAIGEKEGYALILNNLDVKIVMFAKPSIDLTKRITEEMDKGIKKEEKGKK